jgi:hypothetical protein
MIDDASGSLGVLAAGRSIPIRARSCTLGEKGGGSEVMCVAG